MFFSHSFRRSDFTYGVTKDQNVKSLLCKKTFWRSDFTYGVTKDQNVLIVVVLINSKDIFDILIVYGVFGVLFGFRRSDFRSSDHFPNYLFWKYFQSLPGLFKASHPNSLLIWILL